MEIKKKINIWIEKSDKNNDVIVLKVWDRIYYGQEVVTIALWNTIFTEEEIKLITLLKAITDYKYNKKKLSKEKEYLLKLCEEYNRKKACDLFGNILNL